MSCQDMPPSFLPASPRTKNATPIGTTGNLVGLGATGTLGGTGLEAVLEAAVDVAQRAHAAAAGGLAALGLLTPVDCKESVSRYVPTKPSYPSHPSISQGRVGVHLRVLAEG